MEARGFTPGSKARPQHIKLRITEYALVSAALLTVSLFIAARFR
jgi:energy-coupling factor transporter transmembrane protein EcfT